MEKSKDSYNHHHYIQEYFTCCDGKTVNFCEGKVLTISRARAIASYSELARKSWMGT